MVDMKQELLIRSLKQAAVEFERLEWLGEVLLFGPALRDDPVDREVDLLLVANRTLSVNEKREATGRFREFLEERVQQSLDFRITSRRALETTRGRNVGHGRVLRERTICIFRRDDH